MSGSAAEFLVIGMVLGLSLGMLLGSKLGTIKRLIGQISPPRQCSFCSIPADQAYKLLGGGFNLHICDRCAVLGGEVLRCRNSREAGEFRMEFQTPGVFARCSFCGKGNDDREMFGAHGIRMCTVCSDIAQATLRTV